MKTDSRKTAALLNQYRAYLLLVLLLVLGVFAKNFFTIYNFKSIFDSTVLYALIGAAFTICMIAGHMDLSVGAMANLGAIVTMGMHSLYHMPWAVAILAGVLAGCLFGCLNGILISKFNIHSFIATLGMQFVLKGIMYIFCGGAEIGDKGDYALADILNKQLGPLPLSPKVLVTLAIVILLAVLCASTRAGRNVYMLGGNAETAWLAGINRTGYTIAVFALSGLLCATGGAIFAIAQSSAIPNLGEKGISPLMVGLAATIIGGTNTNGGAGSVWMTFVSVAGLMTMFNVLTTLVGKYEIQILSNGLVLAACVLYETLTKFFAGKRIGMRANLLKEHRSETAHAQ